MAGDSTHGAAAPKSQTAASCTLKVASATHEVKNFAESLTNLVYLLQRNPKLDEDSRKYVQLIENELEQMRSFINQTLARYREIASPIAVSVTSVLDATLQFNKERIAAKHIHIEKRYDCDGVVSMDFEELRQVFSNLVVNALQALQPGGKLIVHVQHSHNWSNTKPQAEGVRVVVADNGVGIPAEYQNKIFRQSFSTKGRGGSGLGLFMTKKIVQEHGGTVWFKSSTKPGRRGSLFSLFLPAAKLNRKETLSIPGKPSRLLSPKENRAIAERLIAENKRVMEELHAHRARYATFKVKPIATR